MTRDITYSIAEERYAIGNNVRTSYGVVVYADAEPDGTATVIASFRDLFGDREILERFVEKCNRDDLSLIHIGEAIADLLES